MHLHFFIDRKRLTKHCGFINQADSGQQAILDVATIAKAKITNATITDSTIANATITINRSDSAANAHLVGLEDMQVCGFYPR